MTDERKLLSVISPKFVQFILSVFVLYFFFLCLPSKFDVKTLTQFRMDSHNVNNY